MFMTTNFFAIPSFLLCVATFFSYKKIGTHFECTRILGFIKRTSFVCPGYFIYCPKKNCPKSRNGWLTQYLEKCVFFVSYRRTSTYSWPVHQVKPTVSHGGSQPLQEICHHPSTKGYACWQEKGAQSPSPCFFALFV